MMPDREKVINGLEWILNDIKENGHYQVDNYEDEIREALALLKEQEPKLLTIEEITGDGECWFESIYGACGYADCRFESIAYYGNADCYTWTASKEVEVNRIRREPEYVSLNDFMKKWRCWSTKPTDEQRKAVKWDE